MIFVDRIYPIELEIKDTTDTARAASYLDLHIEIDSDDRLRSEVYDKRDYFNFPIVNFPYICSDFPAAPAYGVPFPLAIALSVLRRYTDSDYPFGIFKLFL